MTDEDRDRQTAYHEVGHAVVLWRSGMKFKYVTIKPGPGNLGHVSIRHPRWSRPDIEWNDRYQQHVEHDIVANFAGQIAQAKLLGAPPSVGSMESDDQQSVDMVERFCGSQETREAYLLYCFLSARDIVHSAQNWRAIEAVAKALLERKTLTYEEVIDVIWPGSAALRESLSRASGSAAR